MNDVCGDNRFEIIEAYKKKLIEDTNIESRPDEMAVIDNILLRFWQMGWLPDFQETNVGDTIYRQAAIEAVSEACFELRGVFGRCEDALKALPPAEPETCAYWDRESNICALHRPSAYSEIIHCKDCRYRELDDHYGFMCGLDTGDPYGLGRCADDENWYCADAERRRE